MKLNSITMINSGNFSFAHLKLDAKSIQLSGRNNKGKTSLLWTLPLLFVVDRKQATHPNYTPKESLNFYFKSPDRSYIIFEGYDEKQGYFYMLLRREGDSVKYYFVKKQFDRSMFMEYDDIEQSYTVLPFSRVLENPATGIGAPLKDHREVLAKAISSRKGEVAFLRLANGSKSEQFSNLYKHLFRSSGDDEILKNGILIVNKLKEEVLSMKDELPSSELAEWQREQEEIDTLKEVQEDLAELKAKRNILEEKKVALIAGLSAFGDIDFNQVRQSVNTEHETYQGEIQKLRQTVDSLEQEETDIRRKISNLDGQKGAVSDKIKMLQKKIHAIEEYPDATWLKQALLNLEQKYADVLMLIRSIDTTMSIGEIDKKLQKLNSQKREIEQFVNNHEDTLLMNLSGNKEEIGIINTVLSSGVTSLPKSAILSEATGPQQYDVFSYNGAKIDISSLEIREIPTIEERKRELGEIEQQIKEARDIKENFNEKEKLEREQKKLGGEIQTIRNQLDDIAELDNHRNDLSALKQELIQILDNRQGEEDKEKSIAAQQHETSKLIAETESLKESLSTKEKAIGEFYNRYLDYCRDTEFAPSPVKVLPIDVIHDKVMEKKQILEKQYGELRSASNIYQSAEEETKRHTTKIKLYDDNTLSQNDLLTALEQKCENLDIKAKELRDRVGARTNIFKGRVKRFLEQVENIKKYTSRINSMLSKYTISDLSGIHIRFIPNERLREEVERLTLDNASLFSHGLYDTDDTIIRYIRTEKTVLLSDLFEIAVERTKRDSDTKRDKREKSKQSNGTERMLHVMLLLILMRELIHRDDTIPFLIDEVMDIDDINQGELLKFFDELNLLPVSASPHIAHTFEKVYYIEEVTGGKSYINDNTCTRKESKEGM